MNFLKIIICISLFAMTFQDLKYRAISWYYFAIILISIIIIQSSSINDETNFILNVICNIGFVTLLFLILLVLYNPIKKPFADFFNEYSGIGDWLLFLILSFAFDTVSFVFYMTIGFILSLFTHLILRILIKNYSKTVPLAGLMSCLLGLILLISIIIPDVINFEIFDIYSFNMFYGT